MARRSEPDALRRQLAGLRDRPLTVEIVSDRMSRFFSPATAGALRSELEPHGLDVSLRALAGAAIPSRADVVLLLCHVRKAEPAYLDALRNAGYDGVVASWFWDNHHAIDANRRIASLVDVAVAAHGCHAAYLAEDALLLPAVNLCVAQWTAAEARAGWDALRLSDVRRTDLYGGFGRYKGSARTVCLESLIDTGDYPALYFTDGGTRADYFTLTAGQRFAEWAGYGVSLCLPYRNDLSNRFFDAWLTGQIPIVTPDIPELASAWATEHLDRHFVCAAGYEQADIDAAHRRAVELFHRGGVAGQQARHQLALERHMLHHRVAGILSILRQCGDERSRSPQSSQAFLSPPSAAPRCR